MRDDKLLNLIVSSIQLENNVKFLKGRINALGLSIVINNSEEQSMSQTIQGLNLALLGTKKSLKRIEDTMKELNILKG